MPFKRLKDKSVSEGVGKQVLLKKPLLVGVLIR